MNDNYDLVIIGAGVAGMTSALYAKRANLNVLLLDQLAPGGQMINTQEIENYMGTGKVGGADLAYNMYEQIMKLNIPFEYATAAKIELEGNIKKIICEEGQIFTAKNIIIATGTKPNKLNIPGESKLAGKSLSWCAICDGPKYKGKDVVVIGGGNSAVEEAIFLSEICNTITLITLFDLTADAILCDHLRTKTNVEIISYAEIQEFDNLNNSITIKFKLTKEDIKKQVICDGIFEYIGLIPQTKVFKDLGILNKMGYLIVNDKMQTSLQGIYGAGDVNEKFLRQIITASADGAIAAQVISNNLE